MPLTPSTAERPKAVATIGTAAAPTTEKQPLMPHAQTNMLPFPSRASHVIAVAIGTTLPQHGATFNDNFSQPTVPPAALYLRLVVLGLIVIGGVLGFLVSRPWGVGMALGTISIGIWQTITAAAKVGNQPLPIAGGNFFADGAHPFQPHVVTMIGIGIAAVSAVAGLVTMAVRRND